MKRRWRQWEWRCQGRDSKAVAEGGMDGKDGSGIGEYS